MAAERGGTVCAMDDRYCVDNGAMIAYAGILEFVNNVTVGCDHMNIGSLNTEKNGESELEQCRITCPQIYCLVTMTLFV